MISVYGSSGFIGSKFCETYPDEIIKIPREQREPESNIILNFISTTDNHNVFTDPFLDINTNLTILIEILEAAREKYGNDFTFIQISSWSVYGDVELPAKETAICNPRGFYGITKRTAEQLLISYCNTYGINFKILRLCNVLGETDYGVSKKKNALQYLIGELKEGHDINLYYGGDFIRDYMYVNDVVKAIHLCIMESGINEVINIGSGTYHKFVDLVEYAKTMLRSTSKIELTAPEISAFHTLVQSKDMFLDNTKLRNLGFAKDYNVFEALDIIIERMKND